MKTKKTWGGPRPGAGCPKVSGKGRRVLTRSISLPPETWAEIDRQRGALSRSEWIKELTKLNGLLAEEYARHKGVLARQLLSCPAWLRQSQNIGIKNGC
jgi:hypothetical protein